MAATVLAGVLAAVRVPARVRATRLIDDFEHRGAWSAHPADGVVLGPGAARRASPGRRPAPGLRLHRRRLRHRPPRGGPGPPGQLRLPFPAAGRGSGQHPRIQAVDATGENVWWSVRRDLAWPGQWQVVTIGKRQLSFAWGPRGGGESAARGGHRVRRHRRDRRRRHRVDRRPRTGAAAGGRRPAAGAARERDVGRGGPRRRPGGGRRHDHRVDARRGRSGARRCGSTWVAGGSSAG